MKLVSTYSALACGFLLWEYPGKQGIGCNITLSTAVAVKPFIGPDGNSMSNVSAFADVHDHIEIMNYDVWGPDSSSVGSDVPLKDYCAPSPQGSAESGVKAWVNAGFPENRIILGVPSYGHSYHVNPSIAYNSSSKIHPYVPFDKSQQPAGDKWDSTAGDTDQCGNPTAVGGIFKPQKTSGA
ncbi:hypothetical protein BJV74DRAFT_821259 [Russula compacta]|nr:hypothetical protein BJV74DRAFT_821259 [Russula compacta]